MPQYATGRRKYHGTKRFYKPAAKRSSYRKPSYGRRAPFKRYVSKSRFTKRSFPLKRAQLTKMKAGHPQVSANAILAREIANLAATEARKILASSSVQLAS